MVDVPWVLTPEMVSRAELASARLFEVVGEGGYPPEWPVVSWLVKQIAGGRCEHCGQRRRLAVHHLGRDKLNLQHWNLVALCWDRCHLWVETHVSLNRDQLDLFGEELPWLVWRLEDRRRWPVPDRPLVASSAGPDAQPVGPVVAAGQPCACGCGEWVSSRPNGRPRRYFSQACRQRVYREGRLEQLSLLAPSRS